MLDSTVMYPCSLMPKIHKHSAPRDTTFI